MKKNNGKRYTSASAARIRRLRRRQRSRLKMRGTRLWKQRQLDGAERRLNAKAMWSVFDIPEEMQQRYRDIETEREAKREARAAREIR